MRPHDGAQQALNCSVLGVDPPIASSGGPKEMADAMEYDGLLPETLVILVEA
jgi:hypothetical protein